MLVDVGVDILRPARGKRLLLACVDVQGGSVELDEIRGPVAILCALGGLYHFHLAFEYAFDVDIAGVWW